MFEVIPLGVGAAIPTPDRHLSGTLVRRAGRLVLFDCGEGTQLQLVRGGLTRGRLDAVCVTHLHGDHVYGLPGLLTTLALLDRDTPLTVVGPEGIEALVRAMPGLNRGDPPFETRFIELVEGDEHAVVYEDEGITIGARPLDHRVPCWGYRYQERPRPGALDGPAARALGVEGSDLGLSLAVGLHEVSRARRDLVRRLPGLVSLAHASSVAARADSQPWDIARSRP